MYSENDNKFIGESSKIPLGFEYIGQGISQEKDLPWPKHNVTDTPINNLLHINKGNAPYNNVNKMMIVVGNLVKQID